MQYFIENTHTSKSKLFHYSGQGQCVNSDVTVPCRNQRLFCCVFRSHCHIEELIAKLQLGAGLTCICTCWLLKYPCIYKAQVSPTQWKFGNSGIEIWDCHTCSHQTNAWVSSALISVTFVNLCLLHLCPSYVHIWHLVVWFEFLVVEACPVVDLQLLHQECNYQRVALVVASASVARAFWPVNN